MERNSSMSDGTIASPIFIKISLVTTASFSPKIPVWSNLSRLFADALRTHDIENFVIDCAMLFLMLFVFL